jgi:hypothetical protein
METQKLTVRLPVDDIAYLKGYAQKQGITVTEVLHRYIYRLRELKPVDIHPEVSRLSGLVPSNFDPKEAYTRYLEEKHQ